MIEAVQIGNFKAFGHTQNIPIRPITLIFGANSAGKSSLLHGLILARHAHDSGSFDVRKTFVGGEAIDLGGFRQFVHRHEEDEDVRIGFELRLHAVPGLGRFGLAAGEPMRVVLTIGLVSAEGESGAAPTVPALRVLRIFVGQQLLLCLTRESNGAFRVVDFDCEAFSPYASYFATMAPDYDPPISETDAVSVAQIAIKSLVSRLSFDGTSWLPRILSREQAPLPDGSEVNANANRPGWKRISESVSELFPAYFEGRIGAIVSALGAELQRLRYLSPLRTLLPRHTFFLDSSASDWEAGGISAWNSLKQSAEARAKVNDWLAGQNRLGSRYQIELRRYFEDKGVLKALREAHEAHDPMARYAWTYEVDLDDVERGKLSRGEWSRRQAFEARWKRFDEWKKEYFDKHGDLPPGSQATPLGGSEDEVEAWIEARTSELKSVSELVLLDQRTGATVSHRDLGVGISQILPVLVHAYADKERLIAIEQPEIHLHPALQAELGDVFIQSALGEQRNTFLLETHSEHLILRLLRRVRETTEGTLPPGLPPVRPEDLSVLYVQPGENGAEVIEMPVTPDGDFGRPWPGGFFAERLEDLP